MLISANYVRSQFVGERGFSTPNKFLTFILIYFWNKNHNLERWNLH
jgi:hypothetical protein